MELRQVKRTMKELGLNKFHNPVKFRTGCGNPALGSESDMMDFIKIIFETGRIHKGITYRANVIIMKNNGIFDLMFNDFQGVKLGQDVGKDFIKEFTGVMNDDDCVVIYETAQKKYAVVTQ